MSALIPTSIPPASEITPGQFEVGFPPRGSAPALFGAQINALLGHRGLRDGCRHHQIGVALDDYAETPGYDDPVRIEIPRGPVSNTLWIGISVLAEQRVSGDDPEVTAWIETEAGVTIDGAIRWSFDNGYLPASPSMLERLERTTRDLQGLDPGDPLDDDDAPAAEEAFGLFWRRADLDQTDRWITTGWGRGAIADEPRLIELADSEDPEWAVGDPLYLAVASDAVRIYSVTWAEAWAPTLPDA